jgi:putative spermidine/putrescine transport system ATP-binding protein
MDTEYKKPARGLTLEGIEKRYGDVLAVKDVDLHLPQGKFVCFLGPSGCGKTTLLRLIAGLEAPTRGKILHDGHNITAEPAYTRGFGMVFQSLALFPHLSVGRNIEYGLRISRMDKKHRRERAEELLDLVQLPGLYDRHVGQLSGGQRQRVAIARALAKEPRLFLLDEPLSALDAKLRETMQIELRMLQQRLGVTTILVTHDQTEAMTMSDYIVVLGENRVQQMGTPLDIYRNPANTFVAQFIGASNLLSGTLTNPRQVEAEGVPLVADPPEGMAVGAKVMVSIRPEDVLIAPGAQTGENRLRGRVTFVRDTGARVEIHIKAEGCGTDIVSMSTPKDRPDVRQGDEVTAELPAPACVVLAS